MHLCIHCYVFLERKKECKKSPGKYHFIDVEIIIVIINMYITDAVTV